MTYRIYSENASWFELLTTPADYVEEAEVYRQTLTDLAAGKVRTLLELGSGAGNNAAHLKQHFDLTLVDQSPEMLALSKRLNPECTHAEGDMRTARIERSFDAVFVHDAIAYMTTVEDLRAAARTAYVHCRAGGAALFVPKFLKETFTSTTRHGGHDTSALDRTGDDGRALRWLHWSTDPDPEDTMYSVHLTCVLRAADGSFQVESEEHVNGLFPRETWHEVLVDSGFRAPRFRTTENAVLVMTHRPETMGPEARS